MCLFVVLISAYLASGAWQGRKTRFAIRTNDNCVSGKIIAFFLDRGFLT